MVEAKESDPTEVQKIELVVEGEEHDFTEVVTEIRKNFRKGVLKSVESRLNALKQLHKMLEECEDEIYEALYKDLRKPRVEADIMEITQNRIELGNAIQNLSKWVKPKRVASDLPNKMATCEIRTEPLGVVLILGPWNYPFLTLLNPLIGAIAAGNCTIMKPSEHASNVAQLLERIIPKYLSKDYVRLINGGIPVSTALLKQKFDHIFYTGSSTVGRIVMKAAAEHLTPVTLELGGKCPAIVDDTCNFDVVGQRIAWGKLVNAGQTCVGVDFILYIGDCQEKLIGALKKAMKQFYGENPKDSASFGRIINARHFHRISKLIDKSKVVYGGEADEDDLYISPTIMQNVTGDDLIMQEEIFGPLLPIIKKETIQEAIEFINEREKPLALYVFSNDYSLTQQITDETSSGSVCINDTVVQTGVPHLPFGGVGESGIGKYTGKASFEIFSHQKSYMYKNQKMESVNGLRYPPFKKNWWPLRCAQWLATPKVKT